jgi:hypothetical protein
MSLVCEVSSKLPLSALSTKGRNYTWVGKVSQLNDLDNFQSSLSPDTVY